MKKDNIVVVKSLDFAVEAVKYSEELYLKGYVVISKQLVRCATSIGANIWEAQQAESRNDFIHKLKIALKEASETSFWLELCRRVVNDNKSNNLIGNVEELTRIMSRIIATAKQNNKS